MAAKRKKTTKRAGDGAVPRNDQQADLVPPANGPVRGGRAGVGRGQATPQTRRYAFRRS